MWNFQVFMNSKKNSCRGNYMRKYGIQNFWSRWELGPFLGIETKLRYLLRLSHLYLQQFHPHMKPKPFEALDIYFQFHPLFLGNVLSRLNLNTRKKKSGMSLIIFFSFQNIELCQYLCYF